MIGIQTPFYRRYWILLVFRAAAFSGSATISSDLFHRLVYFVNALMPSVDLRSETARVLKASYGPFFPDYQWDLDRLVGQRLISISNPRWISDDKHFFGKFRITDSGVLFAEKIAFSSPFFSDVERAISELVSAFMAAPTALSSLASGFDANFGQDTIREGETIDFGEWQKENFSTNAADFLFQTWLSKILRGINLPKSVDLTSDKGIELTAGHFNENQQLFHQTDHDDSDLNAWEPRTSSPARKRAFHLYAHYLVQSILQSHLQVEERI